MESIKRANYTHGKADTPTYGIWRSMKRRCHNPNDAAYPRYGGRGIAVCDRWRDNFGNFLADMGERPAGLTLDRIENNKGYEPGNCRWATYKQQADNSSAPIVVEHKGQRRNLTEWADHLGISPQALNGRLRRMPAEEALSFRKSHRWKRTPD